MRKSVNVKGGAEPIGPFSHAVIANGFIFVSGQGPVDSKTGSAPEGFHHQVRQTLDNIKVILNEVGAGMEDVVKVEAYLADLSLFAQYNEVYREYFPSEQPARTTTGADLLMSISIEIDCIAVLPE